MGGGYKVYCNCPYGREISKWVEKAYNENKKGVFVVLLLPARTDTRWFHEYIYKKHEIRFIRGRLKFNDCNNSAPFPSMVVVMRSKRGKEYMIEDLLKIVKHYGIDKQLKYIHSEYYELDEAILKEREISFNSEGDLGDREALRKAKDHIAEEIADICVMLGQFQHYYGIKDELIESIMQSKIKRQLERIESEQK